MGTKARAARQDSTQGRTAAARAASRSSHIAPEHVVDAFETGTLEMFRALARALSNAGVRDEVLRAAAHSLVADIGTDAVTTPRDTEDAAVRVAAGRVLSLWCSTPEYVDDVGQPKAIRETGPAPSIDALLRACIDSAPARKATLQMLRGSPSVQRGDDGLWRTLQGVTFRYQVDVAVSRLIDLVEGLVRTNTANIANGPERMFECTASVESIPQKSIVEFSPVAKRFLQSGVEGLDRWLEKSRSNEAPTGKYREVGVAAFAYAIPKRRRAKSSRE